MPTIAVQAELHSATEPVQRTASARPPSQTSQEVLDQKKILIVEDSKHIRHFVRRALELAGAKVDAACDGIEGVELSRSDAYDLILVDIQMPGIDGFETVKLMRQRDIRCPILAFTAHAMKEERERCLQSGFDGHIGKPIEYQQLLQVVQQYTEGMLASYSPT